METKSNHYSAGILEQSLGAKNRVGIGLSYWPARLHRLADSWAPKKLKILSLVGVAILYYPHADQVRGESELSF